MNLIVLQIPVHTEKNNTVQGKYDTLHYTIILDEVRVSDYNQSVTLPAKTVITKNARSLLSMDWDTEEINMLFMDKSLMKDYSRLKIKNKRVNVGLMTKHRLVEELLDQTPIHYEKDSIQQSLWLLNLKKVIDSYETIIPHNLLNVHNEVKNSLKRVSPVSAGFNLAKLNNGFSFTGSSVTEVKKSFRIKHFSEKSTYQFTSTGKPFYSLGKLARLSLALEDMWNR